MSASTFINYRSIDDIYDQIVDYMSKGYVTVDIEEITFLQGTSTYELGNSNIMSITSIEGMGADGHIIPPTGYFNGVSALELTTDFTLGSSIGTDDYGVDLYSGITFVDNQKFEHNSTVYVTYIYYDENKKTDITSFANGSVASMLARAMAIQIGNLYAQNERLYNAGNLALATGADLDNHGEIWGVARDTGSISSGTVLVTVGAGDNDLTVTTATAFVASLAGDDLIFNATVGGTVSAGSSQEFAVESASNGYKYNVGANSITKIYSTNDLSGEISSATITVNNWANKLDASSNLFIGGTDRQTDKQYRDAIYLQARKVGRGTLDAIRSALEDLDNVTNVNTRDWHSNKDIANGIFNIQAVNNSGFKLLTDTASITSMVEVIEAYRPAGQSYNIQHPMAIMIDFSGTAVIDDDDYDKRESILTLIDNSLTTYINNLKIGEDVLYAELLAKAMEIGGVYDFTVDKLYYSEYATNPLSVDLTSHRLQDNEDGAGTTYKAYYEEFVYQPSGNVNTLIWSGTSTFTVGNDVIVNTPTPSAYLAINDGNDNWIRDPAYAIDWYTSNGTGTIVVDPLAGSGVNRILTPEVDRLNLYYETAETDTVNGVRLKFHGAFVSGVTSATVKVELWSGVSAPDGSSHDYRLESGTITVLSGTDDYELLFSSPLTIGNPEDTYYLVMSGTSTLASGAYVSVPVANSGTTGAQGTNLYSGSTQELYDETWGKINNTTALLHTIITTSGTENIIIEANANIPDVAVAYSVDIGFSLKSNTEVV